MSTHARRWVSTSLTGIDSLELVEHEVPEPGRGEVTVDVSAAGVNPADWKYLTPEFAPGGPSATFPLAVGFEVAGVVSAIGPDTELGSGGGRVGDEVLAFRVEGGYTTRLTTAASDVFAKPARLSFSVAAGLLLTATTGLDMIRVAPAQRGQTALVHGASGSTGSMLLQLLQIRGVPVIATASERNRSVVESYGATWTPYGTGLADRVRALSPGGIDVAYDCVGTDEAIDVSLELLASTESFVTIANSRRARSDGLRFISGGMPESKAYRDAMRPEVIEIAANGHLEVRLGPSFPLDRAPDALRLLAAGHPGGKITLLP